MQDQRIESDACSVSNGTKQGCETAPMLFSIIFSIMLQDAFRDSDIDVYIQFRTNGNTFIVNLQRLKAKTKTTELNNDVNQCGTCGFAFHIKRAQLRWSGHLVRMTDDRIPKELFHC